MLEGGGLDLLPRPALRHPVHRFRRRSIDFDREVAVMAVVNRTPDSFFDRGSTFALDAATAAADAAAAAGAQWIDVGGRRFSPGRILPPEDELARVLPVVEGVRDRFGGVLSVDTFEPLVAARCLDAGADVINDTTGLRDPRLVEVVAERGAHVVITHSLAGPGLGRPAARYGDVVGEVRAFLEQQAEAAVRAGIREDRILLDPGHDLNKTTDHSLALTRRFREFATLGFPTVAAVSNKDFVGETLDLPLDERLAGSLAAAVLCVVQGARVVRMHDPSSALAAVQMTEAVLGAREPLVKRHNVEPGAA